MSSLWLADRANRPSPANALLEADRRAAVLLARAGKSVLVLEALFAGAGATGNTTAKISLLQGTKMSKIVAKQGQKAAQQYVEGQS